uniref:Uncharacterized protein n=1 Tax=Bos mutus grunniens TaxID=30521 RepID=A0A8B9XKA9_BOSMU
MLKRRHFQEYYVNGEKKYSIVRTLGPAKVFCSVFSFIVYFGALKTQGQILTKEVFIHTKY